MKLGITAGTILICGLFATVRAADLPGKAVFQQSCKNCHGPDGKGDNIARSFYKVNIPRLDSAYVQAKSDDELRKIITGGIRKMEPVRLGNPTDPHRSKLNPEQVTDVIAYVRTLKP